MRGGFKYQQDERGVFPPENHAGYADSGSNAHVSEYPRWVSETGNI